MTRSGLERGRTDSARDADRVIVIGSGPSGAIAARTLIEAGVPVTLLESGRRTAPGLLIRAAGKTLVRGTFGRRDLSPFRVASGRTATWLHIRAAGGLSNYWTGAVPRFDPQDFCDGARLDDRYVWPVRYEDLEPYYARVEEIVGVTGGSPRHGGAHPPVRSRTVELPRAWSSAQERANAFGQHLAPVPLADGSPWMVTRRATAFNSFDHLIRPLGGDSLFDLRLGAHALRLEWDRARRRVTAVRYVDRARGSTRRLEGAAVVLAAGPLESTRILLNSTSDDFPAGLGNPHGVLGRYLHDHPYDVSVAEFDRPVSRLTHSINLSREPYEASQPLQGTLTTFGNTRMSLADRVLNLTPLPTRRLGVIVFGTMVPEAESRASLHPNAKDEFGLPLLELDIQFDAGTIANIARGRDRAREVLGALGPACAIRPLIDAHLPGQSTHYGGTIRMHASPEHGMLDGWNRMHAVRNVIVADASAFTTGPEKNPTLTAMALSARAAERLATELRGGPWVAH